MPKNSYERVIEEVIDGRVSDFAQKILDESGFNVLLYYVNSFYRFDLEAFKRVVDNCIFTCTEEGGGGDIGKILLSYNIVTSCFDALKKNFNKDFPEATLYLFEKFFKDNPDMNFFELLENQLYPALSSFELLARNFVKSDEGFSKSLFELFLEDEEMFERFVKVPEIDDEFYLLSQVQDLSASPALAFDPASEVKGNPWQVSCPPCDGDFGKKLIFVNKSFFYCVDYEVNGLPMLQKLRMKQLEKLIDEDFEVLVWNGDNFVVFKDDQKIPEEFNSDDLKEELSARGLMRDQILIFDNNVANAKSRRLFYSPMVTDLYSSIWTKNLNLSLIEINLIACKMGHDLSGDILVFIKDVINNALSGNLDDLQKLFEKGDGDIEIPDDIFRELLKILLLRGDFKMLNFLRTKNPIEKFDGMSIDVIEAGNLPALKYLLYNELLNFEDVKIFDYAVALGKVDIVNYLKDKFIDDEKLDLFSDLRSDPSVFFEKMVQSGNVEMVKVLEPFIFGLFGEEAFSSIQLFIFQEAVQKDKKEILRYCIFEKEILKSVPKEEIPKYIEIFIENRRSDFLGVFLGAYFTYEFQNLDFISACFRSIVSNDDVGSFKEFEKFFLETDSVSNNSGIFGSFQRIMKNQQYLDALRERKAVRILRDCCGFKESDLPKITAEDYGNVASSDPDALYVATNGTANSNGVDKEAGSFQMRKQAKILNCDAIRFIEKEKPRIITEFLKIDERYVNSNSYFARDFDEFETFAYKNVLSDDFSVFEEKNDGFYVNFYFEFKKAGNFLLPFLTNKSQLAALKVEPPSAIANFKTGKAGSFLIEVNQECTISYVLKANLEADHDVPSEGKIGEILQEYDVNRKRQNLALRGKGEFDDYYKFLDYVFKNPEEYSCLIRVEALTYQFEKNSVDKSLYKIVNVDNNHVALMIFDKGQWKYHNLGGLSAQRVYEEEKQEKTSRPSRKRGAQKIVRPSSSRGLTGVGGFSSTFGGPSLSPNIKKRKSQDLPRLFEASSFALGGQSNVLLEILRREDLKRPIFYIDSYEGFDLNARSIKIGENSCEISQSGYLSDFFAEVEEYNKSNPSLPAILMVNWVKFSAKQRTMLNTLLDEEPSVCGRKLPKLQIASLSDGKINDSSFYSRHNKEVIDISDLTLKPSKEVELEISEVDLEGFGDWKAKLFGRVCVVNNEIIWKKSDFVKEIESGLKAEFKIQNCSDKNELQRFLAQAQALGYFSYLGYKIYFDDALKFKVEDRSFDFSKFEQVEKKHLLVANSDSRTIPQDCQIINTQLFDLLLHQKSIEDGVYNEKVGLIERMSKKTLRLALTSDLSASQYYCMLNEAKKHGVKLEIFLAKNVKIPQNVKDLFFVEEAKKQENEEEFVKAGVAFCDDYKEFSKDIVDLAKKTVVVNVEDYSYQDLIAAISFEIKGKKYDNFVEAESDFVEALKAGRQIILQGNFHSNLLQMLEPILTKDYAKNLALVIKPQVGVKQFQWLNDLDFLAFDDKYKMQKNSVPRIISEENIQRDSFDLTSQPKRFFENRKEIFNGYLGQNPMLALIGESGVGKTALVNSMADSLEYDFFWDFKNFENWASDEGEKKKVLVIDEANMIKYNFTMFEPFKEAFLSGKKCEILYKGKFYEIDPKKHKVVFMFNQNVEQYQGGRFRQELFKDEFVPQINFMRIPPKAIEHLLKVEIFDKVKFTKEFAFSYFSRQPFFNSLEEDAKRLFVEDERFIRSHFLPLFQKEMRKKIDCYQQAFGKKDEITIRELQEYALRFLATKIEKNPVLPDIRSEKFVSTSATKAVEEAIFECILVRKKQQEGILPQGGTNGVLLEGSSGIGKSALIKAYLLNQNIEYVKIDASLLLKDQERLLIEAFEQGKAVFIDELDVIIDQGIERVLNAVLSGNHPFDQAKKPKAGFMLFCTANGIVEEGRQTIGPAIRHRLNCPRVSDSDEYSQEDVAKIIKVWLGFDVDKKCDKDEYEQEINELALNYKASQQAANKMNLRDFQQYVFEESKVGQEVVGSGFVVGNALGGAKALTLG